MSRRAFESYDAYDDELREEFRKSEMRHGHGSWNDAIASSATVRPSSSQLLRDYEPNLISSSYQSAPILRYHPSLSSSYALEESSYPLHHTQNAYRSSLDELDALPIESSYHVNPYLHRSPSPLSTRRLDYDRFLIDRNRPNRSKYSRTSPRLDTFNRKRSRSNSRNSGRSNHRGKQMRSRSIDQSRNRPQRNSRQKSPIRRRVRSRTRSRSRRRNGPSHRARSPIHSSTNRVRDRSNPRRIGRDDDSKGLAALKKCIQKKEPITIDNLITLKNFNINDDEEAKVVRALIEKLSDVLYKYQLACLTDAEKQVLQKKGVLKN